MRLEAVELLRLELVLVSPLATSSHGHYRRPVVLVRLRTDQADGAGECEALAAPTYTEEYADGAERVLSEHLVPRLWALGAELPPVPQVMEHLGEVRGNHMAKAAIEMALLDAEGRAAARSLADLLGATASSVPAGATIGLQASTEAAVELAGAARRAGYRRLKVKIAPGTDVAPLRAIRAAFPDLVLVADANGAYRPEVSAHRSALEALDRLGLAAIEQPFPAGELLASAELTRRLVTVVLLDESIASERDAELAVALGAAGAISVKPARLGGLLAARRVHARCVDAGLAVSVGGMLETGLGRAAALAFAALPGVSLPGDLGASDRYFVPDLTEPHRLDAAGNLPVPRGAGLGVELVEDVVRAATVRRHRWP